MKAAFPNFNYHQLLDSILRQGFFPKLTNFIASYLTACSTKIAFGDFESEPKLLNIGLPQKSPLSVILYIHYNTSLLTQASDMQDKSSLGFIDDVAFIITDKSSNVVQ